MKTEQLDVAELVHLIWETKGKVGLVAERLAVSTTTIYAYAKKYASVRRALDVARAHANEVLLDTAEAKLQSAVLAGARWSIVYTLSNHPLAKQRGWGPKVQNEISGPDGKPVAVEDVTNARERIAGRIAGLAARQGTSGAPGQPDGG